MNFTYITSYMEYDEALSMLSPAQLKLYRKFVPEGSVNENWNTEMNPKKKKIVEDLFAKYSPECKFIETDDIEAIKGVDMITTENWGFFTDPVETWLPGIFRFRPYQVNKELLELSLIHISEPTRQCCTSRMPSSA